jgi:CDP-6-deoxy-D-xylo-4-hexulose-3-dehydrase
MVCTDDEDLYYMLIEVRAHGWDRNLPEKRQRQLRQEHKLDQFSAKYAFYDLSFNLRPTEIAGFLGNNQLKYWDEIVRIRKNNFKKFQLAIEKNDDFIALDFTHMNLVSNFSMPVICKNKKLADRYKNKFVAANVEIRPIIAGDITRQPFYKKYVKDDRKCNNAQKIDENGFYFPNHPELKPNEINLILKLLLRK